MGSRELIVIMPAIVDCRHCKNVKCGCFFLIFIFSRSRVTMIPLHLVQVSCGAG